MRRIALVAALALAGLLALVWLERVDREGPALARSMSVPDEPARTPSDLAAVQVPEPAPLVARETKRSRESAAPPRGRLRGRLVRADDRAPYRAERIVVLASEGQAVAVTLRSDSDGRFRSERAFPRGEVRAWISDPESGEVLASHRAAFEPESHEEWLVPVPTPASTEPVLEPREGEAALIGQVVDLAGRPVAGALVKAVPLFPSGSRSFVRCDEGGRFGLGGLGPGPWRVLVQGRFAAAPPLEITLVSGRNDAGRILVPAEPDAGGIRGRLEAVEGEGEDAERPFAFLLLRDASGKELVVPTDWGLFRSGSEGAVAFEVEELPAGEYELEVVSLDGRAYEPSLLRVRPPAEGLVFRASRTPDRDCNLRVRDARTGDELERFVILVRQHGQWWGGGVSPGELARSPCAWERWVVLAEGYRPATGAFARAGTNEPLEAEMLPGHGQAILFKDLESDRMFLPEPDDHFGPGLAGVVVLADGVAVATSDGDGLALVDLPRAPDRIEFVHPGWRVAPCSSQKEGANQKENASQEEKEPGLCTVGLMRE